MITAIGGPTAVLEIGGLRLLTDPTFDPPGTYPSRQGVDLHKTEPPALSAEAVGPVDAVLLSHDQHKDNLDHAGRDYLSRVPIVLTTESGAGRLGGSARGLPLWEHVDLPRPGGGTLRVTAVPAEHGPAEALPVMGDVIGFMLSGDGLPMVYVSGDNASVDVVRTIVEHLGRPQIAVLFAGGAQVPDLPGAYLTLSAAAAVEAARVLEADTVVALHVDGWAHFSQGIDEVAEAFVEEGLGDRLLIVTPGQSASM
jgi:L-ascorbate metabolism protein UlaG (beta-lactamase superfamily)